MKDVESTKRGNHDYGLEGNVGLRSTVLLINDLE